MSLEPSYNWVNSARARNFTRASGILAKTDRLDVKVLAEMGVRMDMQPDTISSPERIENAELSTRRDQLVEFRKQDRTRAKLIPEGQARGSIERYISWLDKEIVRFDKAIADKINTSKQISKQIKLLTSIPGIGPIAATVLVAMLPELETLTRRSLAALNGLAPINHDSENIVEKEGSGAGDDGFENFVYGCVFSQLFVSTFQRVLSTLP